MRILNIRKFITIKNRNRNKILLALGLIDFVESFWNLNIFSTSLPNHVPSSRLEQNLNVIMPWKMRFIQNVTTNIVWNWLNRLAKHLMKRMQEASIIFNLINFVNAFEASFEINRLSLFIDDFITLWNMKRYNVIAN